MYIEKKYTNKLYMDNNEFCNIDGHSLYEVNVFGDVRKKSNKKIQTIIDGKVRLIKDETNKRTLRSVNTIVKDAFYPDLEGKREALTFIEGIGYRPKTNLNNDETLLQNLLVGNCDYKIKARKNYNNEITFVFQGKMTYDIDVLCLIVNEKKDTIQLYQSDVAAEEELCEIDGDVIYYLSVNCRRPKGVEGDGLLEHILMAKYYYIKAKVKEDDISCDLEKLKQKYLSYDFEERYDLYDAVLLRQKNPTNDYEIQQNENRVVKQKKSFPEEKVFTEEELEQIEKERAEEKNIKWLRETNKPDLDLMRRQRETEKVEKQMRSLEGETARRIKRYNQVFGTNFGDLETMSSVFKQEVKRKRQRKEQARRQEEKKEDKRKKLQQQLRDL